MSRCVAGFGRVSRSSSQTKVKERKAYICEVVTHLPTGIQYVKNKQPDTEARLVKKFTKDIQYGQRAFRDYNVSYMLWSPVVHRSTGSPKYNQPEVLKEIGNRIKATTGIEIEFVVNEDYLDAINFLRVLARSEPKELKSPVMRFLQIEEWCRKNCSNIEKKFKSKVAPRSAHTTSTITRAKNL